MRARARYAKTGKLRFTSAIDLGRLWERALRKADLPIAYSEGFSPHPKVSFPDALPLGYASTGEYVELTFTGPLNLDRGIAALNAAFPDGLAVLHAFEVEDGAPKLAKLLTASCWELAYPDEVAEGVLAAAVDAALAAGELLVGRERKGETVEVDLRPAIHQLHAHGQVVRAILHHVEPPVRPSEVQLALQARIPVSTTDPISAAEALPEPALVTRVAQGLPTGDGLAEALTGETIFRPRPRRHPPERTPDP